MPQLPGRIAPSAAPRIDVEASGSSWKKWAIGIGVAVFLVIAITIGVAVSRSDDSSESGVVPTTNLTSTLTSTSNGTQVLEPPSEFEGIPVGVSDAGTPEALNTYFSAGTTCPPEGTAWPQWTGPSSFIIGVPEIIQPLYSQIQDGFYNASEQEYTLRFSPLPENLSYCRQPVSVSNECHDTKAATGTLQECGTANGTEMWTHNHGTKLCEPFTYNGCGGSANMFTTQALCAMSCETPIQATMGGTITFRKDGKCSLPPTKPDGSACCRMKMWQPNYAGYYYDDCAAQIHLGGDGVFFFKTELPGSELSAGWGPDPMPHIHYDILCGNCSANEFFTGEHRYWNKFYPQELCDIEECWGKGSVAGTDVSLKPNTVHQAQKEEVVNGELRYTYHMAIPPQSANFTLIGKPTEY